MQTNTLATTASHAFFSCNPAKESLFAVRPGISASDALRTASDLLSVARACAYESTECESLSSGAAYLIEMAKATIDSLESGSTARPDESTPSNVFERLNALHENGVLMIRPEACVIERTDAEGFLDWVGRQVKGGVK